MGKSIQQITRENHLFYRTYSLRITRRYAVGTIIILLFWAMELVMMRFACARIYYYKLAGMENLGNQEVEEWIAQQIFQNPISLENLVIIVMIVSMAAILWYFWHIKSYELHKYRKRMLYSPFLIVLPGNVIFLALMYYKGNPYFIRGLLLAVSNLIPFLSTVRMLLPIEIKESEKNVWDKLDLAVKLINKL